MATHNISMKQFKENRDKVYCVIAFNVETLRRAGTISNISMVRVIKEVQQYQKRNCFCLVFDHVEGSELDKKVSNNFSDYKKFIGVQ